MLLPDCESGGTVQVGCVPDGVGGTLGPVFLDTVTSEVWSFEIATATVVRPYAGPIVECSTSTVDVEVVCASTDGRLLAFNTSTGALTELDGSPLVDAATGVACAGSGDRETVTTCLTDGVNQFQRIQMFDVTGAVPVLIGTVWVDNTGAVTPPPVGPITDCALPQLSTIVQEFCALVDGVGYTAGDKVTLTRVIDLADPLAVPLVQSFVNISAGVDQIVYLENNGVPVTGTPPPNTDLAACPDATPCTDCATVPAGSVV